MTTQLVTANIKHTLSEKVADVAIKAAVSYDPQLVGLNEVEGDRNPLFRGYGRFLLPDQCIKEVFQKLPESGMVWLRVFSGGQVAGVDLGEYEVLGARIIILAKGRDVEDVPGRRDQQGDNEATVVHVRNRRTGKREVLILIHLTAHVQDGPNSYRPGARSDMHREERASLEAFVKHQQTVGRKVWVMGDTNFDEMPIKGLHSCWDERKALPTSGPRTIDIIYGENPFESAETREIHSDHKLIAASA